MKSIFRTIALCTILVLALQGCEHKVPPGQIQVSFPLSIKLVFHDTTFRKNIDGIGPLTVSIKNGALEIHNSERLPSQIAWTIYSSHAGSEMKRSSSGTSAQRTRTFTYISNQVAVDGPPVTLAQTQDLPHIRWVEVTSTAADGDTTSIYVGVPSTSN